MSDRRSDYILVPNNLEEFLREEAEQTTSLPDGSER